jgi:hypothetical protein
MKTQKTLSEEQRNRIPSKTMKSQRNRENENNGWKPVEHHTNGTALRGHPCEQSGNRPTIGGK